METAVVDGNKLGFREAYSALLECQSVECLESVLASIDFEWVKKRIGVLNNIYNAIFRVAKDLGIKVTEFIKSLENSNNAANVIQTYNAYFHIS